MASATRGTEGLVAAVVSIVVIGWAVVILGAMAGMLQPNLLSTAVTRAKQLVVLIGRRRALAKAVRTQGAGRRSTALTQPLRPGPGRAGAG